MTQKLISTDPGTFRRAERKEATDGLDRTCDGNAYYRLASEI